MGIIILDFFLSKPNTAPQEKLVIVVFSFKHTNPINARQPLVPRAKNVFFGSSLVFWITVEVKYYECK